MANSNAMARADADKNHVGAKVLVLDSAGDAGQIALKGMIRAWVNFNGTGTPAIRASANVSSITDNGTGAYTVNFTTAMPDANFAAHITCTDDNAAASYAYEGGTYGQFRTVSAIKIYTYGGGNPRDAQGIYCTIVR